MTCTDLCLKSFVLFCEFIPRISLLVCLFVYLFVCLCICLFVCATCQQPKVGYQSQKDKDTSKVNRSLPQDFFIAARFSISKVPTHMSHGGNNKTPQSSQCKWATEKASAAPNHLIERRSTDLRVKMRKDKP